MNKIVFVILDGVGDRPIPQLNYTTTLESALTPNLDYFARKSTGGLVYSVGKGFAPESDVAVYSMLGYKVKEGYVGRGVIEGLGSGLDFKDGDLALRGNFSTVREDMTIVDRRVGRSLTSEEAKALSNVLNGNIKLSGQGNSVVVKATIGHRCVVHFKAKDIMLSDQITNTDPAYLKVHGMGVVASSTEVMKVAKCEPLNETKEARVSAQFINEFTEQVFMLLDKHPINNRRRAEGKLPGNMILLRDAGSSIPKLTPLEKYYGLKPVIIADMPVEIGIAKTLNAEVFTVGSPMDFKSKAEKTLDLIKDFGLVYTHLKGPDEPGHDGDYMAKKKVIEEIDEKFFGVLRQGLDLDEVLMVVSSDHATPCTLKAHSDDPVPFIIASGVLSRDKICRFTEKECSKGRFGVLKEGSMLLPLVKSLME